MRLEFAGAPEVPVSRAEAWARLMDPAFVAPSVLGMESVETIDATRYRVVSGIGMGPMRFSFTIDLELSDIVAPKSATMRATGKASGSAVDVRSTIVLDELAPDRTRLRWAAVSEVGGPLAGVGAHFVESIARKLTEGFWNDFVKRVAEASEQAA